MNRVSYSLVIACMLLIACATPGRAGGNYSNAENVERSVAAILPVRTSDARGTDTARLRDGVVELLWQEGVENAYPRWSGDGSEILFQSNRTGKWQLYIMNRDGANVRRITNDTFNNNFPDWSFDNSQVAFVSDRGGNEDIYAMNVDGTGLRNLSNNPARDIHPYWTPDGTTVLFNSSRDDEKSFEVYSVRRDGSDLHRLTTTRDVETCARLSPEGERILYLKGLVSGNDEVFVMEKDGRRPVNITRSKAAEGWPAWTPDGRRIVFSSNGSGTFCLYSVAADGSDLRRLTHIDPPYVDARAHVSPDGSEIVFNRQAKGTIGIYRLKVQG